MHDYKNQNSKVINRAFSRFSKNVDEIIKQGMIEVAKAGLQFLVEAHNEHEPNMMHVERNNSMAYAISHNGVLVATESYNGGDYDFPGRAMAMASTLAEKKKGWAAYILSEMDSWYRYDYEVGFLLASAKDVKTSFHKYFKPVK